MTWAFLFQVMDIGEAGLYLTSIKIEASEKTMADRSDDKSGNWREKYLDALDQQEKIERALVAQQEMLRRALVRVSVVADGQDDALDGVLGQLRERMRGAVTGDISTLISRLDQIALNFEQHREQNALDVRTSLTETVKPLQALDLTRSVKKEISQYLAQLPERSKKVHLYPALLQQLATIQQQALKEIEQPKTGFLQKILGGQNTVKSNEVDVSEKTTRDSATYLDEHSSASAQNSLDYTHAARMISLSSEQVSVSGDLPPKFVDQITQVINQFLTGLEKEAPMVKKVQAIRERLSSAATADAFIKTLEELRDLMMQSYLSANEAFATYLKNVNQELADIYALVGGAVESETSRRNASDNLKDSVRKEMESLESKAESATDLAQLKSLVQSQIGNIREALDHFQHGEQSQNQLASQLAALSSKIKVMEDEAEKNRNVLEKQRHKALHDALTGLPNREYYNERANYEYQRWLRYKRPLTMAVFDIDYFKKINDTHGHQAGDRVLKVIGQSVAKRLREVDFFCRYGGEEFVALMPETSLTDAMPVLDAIRAAIANAAFNYKERPIEITLSIGVTEFKAGDDLNTAFVRADEALYAAKSSGRNCVKSI